KSIHTDASTSTRSCSVMGALVSPSLQLECVVNRLLSHHPPVQVADAAAGQLHELVDTPLIDVLFDRVANRFRAARALFYAHQFVHQLLINRNRCTHNNSHYMCIQILASHASSADGTPAAHASARPVGLSPWTIQAHDPPFAA